MEDNESSQVESRSTTVVFPNGGSGGQDRTSRTKYSNVRGENYTLGLLWNFAPKWNLGLRYDTAFRAKAKYEESGTSGGTPLLGTKEKRHVSFPDTLAIGLAYRPNDRLTISSDVTQTDWDDYYVRKADGTRVSLIDASDNVNQKTVNFQTTTTVRLGVEHVFIPRTVESSLNQLWSLRGGLYYDEEPSSGAPGKRDGKPDAFWGAAIGVGLQLKNRVNLDAAYQIRWADSVNGDYIRGVPGFDEDVVQQRFLLSTVVYF
ncbi:MAG: outer membrane protein transport protein [Candidatus Hydrogenedentota bacterium]